MVESIKQFPNQFSSEKPICAGCTVEFETKQYSALSTVYTFTA